MLIAKIILLTLLIAVGIFSASQILVIIIRSIKESTTNKKGVAEDMPKSFKIIIIDNESGEELINSETDCIACAFSNGEEEKDGEKAFSFNQSFLSRSTFHEAAGVLDVVNNLYKERMDKLIDEYIKRNPDSPEAKLKEFFEALEKKAKDK